MGRSRGGGSDGALTPTFAPELRLMLAGYGLTHGAVREVHTAACGRNDGNTAPSSSSE